MNIQEIQRGATITWLSTGLDGEPVERTGIVHRRGETYPGSGVMRVYAKRTGRGASIYRGLVIGVDPATIVACTHKGRQK